MKPPRLKRLAATIVLGGITLAACGDPAARTGLDGGPDAAADAAGLLVDAADDAAVAIPDAADDAAVAIPDAADDAGPTPPPGCGDGVRADGELCLIGAPVMDSPTTPALLRAGDVDGDGLTDLVVPRWVGDGDDEPWATIYFGQPGGGFVAAPAPGSDIISDLQLADIDRDGDLDIHLLGGVGTPTFSGPTWRLMRNDGAAGFATVQTDQLPFDSAITIGDVDGDGRPDLVQHLPDIETAGEYLQILLSTGDRMRTVGTLPLSRFQDRAIADLDGDRRVDLLVVRDQALEVALGLGDGTFAAPATYLLDRPSRGMHVGDVDLDGVNDLVLGGDELTVLPGMAGGGFAAPRLSPAPPWGLLDALTDLDGDGTLDVLISNRATAVATWIQFGHGDGTFGVPVALPPAPHAVACDVDADGALDLVGLSSYGSLRVVRNHGDRRFPTSSSLAARGGSYDVAIADLDGDGVLDLATTSRDDKTVLTARGDGHGGFAAVVSTPAVTTAAIWPTRIVTADLDGDRAPEVIVAGGGSTITVLDNDGAGGLAARPPVAVGDEPRDVVAADVDGDDDLDVVTADAKAGALSLLVNLGGALVPRVAVATGGEPYQLAAGDVTGDGKVDFLVATIAAGPGAVPGPEYDAPMQGDVVLVRATAGGGHAAPEVVLHGDRVEDLVLADLDGDGDLDLAAVQPMLDRLIVLANQGGTFELVATVPILAAASRAIAIVAADLDGDGHVDLITADRDRDAVTVVLGDGALGFPIQRSFGVNDWPLGLAVADLDANGQLDLVIRERTGTLSVLLGQPP